MDAAEQEAGFFHADEERLRVFLCVGHRDSTGSRPDYVVRSGETMLSSNYGQSAGREGTFLVALGPSASVLRKFFRSFRKQLQSHLCKARANESRNIATKSGLRARGDAVDMCQKITAIAGKYDSCQARAGPRCRVTS
jgi:hypothetical protein